MNLVIPVGEERIVGFWERMVDYVGSGRIIDDILNPMQPQAIQKKYRPKTAYLDHFFGIGAVNIGHPILNQIDPAGIEIKADPLLDEAVIQCYREAKGSSLYYG